MPALKVTCVINMFVISICCQQVSRCPREIHHEISQVDPHGTGKEIQTIIDESREFPDRIDLTGILGQMSGHHERSFWAFLEHRVIFDIAYRFNRADNLPGRSWRKRGNFPEGDGN
jgi:hypothetical protein